MTISAHAFEACLKCPTKGWLRSTGEPTTGNAYAEWVATQDEARRLSGIGRLTAELPDGAWAVAPPMEKLKTATWQLATDVPVLTGKLETRLHAVERAPSEGRGRAAQFIPIRFVWRNKLHRDDKLLLAFDARVSRLGKRVGDVRLQQGQRAEFLLSKERTLEGLLRMAGRSPLDEVAE